MELVSSLVEKVYIFAIFCCRFSGSNVLICSLVAVAEYFISLYVQISSRFLFHAVVGNATSCENFM